ncbi:MAG: transposase [Thioalkalivibrio sp.]|nr:transposase [Thioalkalivibrio sp.]
MDRYIGLDAHASSCTVAVIGPSGRRLASHVTETNARALITTIEAIPRQRHLCLEEGALAGWLHEVLAPHVQEIVVTAIPQNRGPKSDKRDAFALAEMLRIGSIPRRVYKRRGRFTGLAYLAKAYQVLVGDDVRVQNRIKSLLRSRGVQVAGSAVYTASGRTAYLDQLPTEVRAMADVLYQQHDHLAELRKRAQKDMIAEARKHPEYRSVRSCPGLGDVRSALLLPVVVTPYRFANKRQFWSYCGLAVVSRSSSDWVRTRSGEWIKAPVQQTRGLNKNFNRTLKTIFKGAAITVIGQRRDKPLCDHYQRLLDGGTKPNLARLTIARQIAAITLALWRNEEVYDPAKLISMA